MSEEEAKNAIFKLHQEYMSHTCEERSNMYLEYQAERELIKRSLIDFKNEKLNKKKKEL